MGFFGGHDHEEYTQDCARQRAETLLQGRHRMGRTLQGQSEAIALTNLTVGGQSVLYELFRKQLDCADRTIRKLELTYFAASITTAVYLRLGKQPNREKILDAFAMNMLKAAIAASQEQISFGAAVSEYQRRFAEYDQLLALVINPELSSTGNPAATLLLHLFECVTGKTARGHMLKLYALTPQIAGYVSDHIEFVRTGMGGGAEQ
jgi:hypothetical protein